MLVKSKKKVTNLTLCLCPVCSNSLVQKNFVYKLNRVIFIYTNFGASSRGLALFVFINEKEKKNYLYLLNFTESLEIILNVYLFLKITKIRIIIVIIMIIMIIIITSKLYSKY